MVGGPAVAGCVHYADVSQQTGYPEAAQASVPALTVGTGEEEWVLGSSAWTVGAGGFQWGRGHCLVQLQGNLELCKAMGPAHGKEMGPAHGKEIEPRELCARSRGRLVSPRFAGTPCVLAGRVGWRLGQQKLSPGEGKSSRFPGELWGEVGWGGREVST